jgi:hypothetical protein
MWYSIQQFTFFSNRIYDTVVRSNQKQNEPQENARIARFEKRDCWIGTKPLTMEILKERLPALFEKVIMKPMVSQCCSNNIFNCFRSLQNRLP